MKRRLSYITICVIVIICIGAGVFVYNQIAGIQLHGRTYPRPEVRAEDQGNVVHINIPCATLTPYADYRDFLTPGSQLPRLMINPVRGYPTPPPAVFETIIPPAEATLVFDNSDGCQ